MIQENILKFVTICGLSWGSYTWAEDSVRDLKSWILGTNSGLGSSLVQEDGETDDGEKCRVEATFSTKGILIVVTTEGGNSDQFLGSFSRYQSVDFTIYDSDNHAVYYSQVFISGEGSGKSATHQTLDVAMVDEPESNRPDPGVFQRVEIRSRTTNKWLTKLVPDFAFSGPKTTTTCGFYDGWKGNRIAKAVVDNQSN